MSADVITGELPSSLSTAVMDAMRSFQPSPRSLVATSVSRHVEQAPELHRCPKSSYGFLLSQHPLTTLSTASTKLHSEDCQEDGATPSISKTVSHAASGSSKPSQTSAKGSSSCSKKERKEPRKEAPKREQSSASAQQTPAPPATELFQFSIPVQQQDQGSTSSTHEQQTVTAKADDSKTTSTPKSAPSKDAVTRYKVLLAENRELKRRQQCRLCQQKPANITLLPCGHLIYCEDCAKTMSHCGTCLRQVLADVRTFLC